MLLCHQLLDMVQYRLIFAVIAHRYLLSTSYDGPTGMSAPLIAAVSSDMSHTSTCAMDSGFDQVDRSAWGILSRFAGVSIVVGRTPLTLTPAPSNSSARTRINETSADFATRYAAAPGKGSSAARAAI